MQPMPSSSLPTSIAFAGSSSSTNAGIFYGPKTSLAVTGGGSLGAVQIIVNTFSLGGGNAITINYTHYVDTDKNYAKLVE